MRSIAATSIRVIKASGAGSLRFDLPAAPHSGQNIAGNWTPPNGNLAMGGTTFKENSTFWVQYRVQFSPSMITNTWVHPTQGPLGWKVSIFHYNQATCDNLEITQREAYSADFPILYTDCGGNNVFSNDAGNWQVSSNTTNLNFQQGDFINQCEYNTFPACFTYTSNEWITFTYKITVGTWGGSNSRIEGWVNTESVPATRKVWDVSQYNLTCNNFPGCTAGAEGFNNITLLPYMTGLDPNSGSAASVWYDELIVVHAIRLPRRRAAPRWKDRRLLRLGGGREHRRRENELGRIMILTAIRWWGLALALSCWPPLLCTLFGCRGASARGRGASRHSWQGGEVSAAHYRGRRSPLCDRRDNRCRPPAAPGPVEPPVSTNEPLEAEPCPGPRCQEQPAPTEGTGSPEEPTPSPQ